MQMLNERHKMLNKMPKNAYFYPFFGCFSIEKNYIFLILEKQQYISKSIELIRTKNRILFFCVAKLIDADALQIADVNIGIRRYSSNIVFWWYNIHITLYSNCLQYQNPTIGDTTL